MKATMLDANGMPVADLPITKDGTGVKLPLPQQFPTNEKGICRVGKVAASTTSGS